MPVPAISQSEGFRAVAARVRLSPAMDLDVFFHVRFLSHSFRTVEAQDRLHMGFEMFPEECQSTREG